MLKLSGNLVSYDSSTDSLICNFPITISKILRFFTPNILFMCRKQKTDEKRNLFLCSFYDMSMKVKQYYPDSNTTLVNKKI